MAVLAVFFVLCLKHPNRVTSFSLHLAMADEAALLAGSYLTNPNLATPHETPSFLRSAALRVVTGVMLSSAVMASLCALLDTPYRFDCVLSAAVCWVASYHYSALTSLRSQATGVVKLVPPGIKNFGTPTPLRLAWQEASADAIRHSDWIVSLHVASCMLPLAPYVFCVVARR